jgi:hypothetical protein
MLETLILASLVHLPGVVSVAGVTSIHPLRVATVHLPGVHFPGVVSVAGLARVASVHLRRVASAHLPRVASFHLQSVAIVASVHLPRVASVHLPTVASVHLRRVASAHLPRVASFHLQSVAIVASVHLPRVASVHLPTVASVHCSIATVPTVRHPRVHLLRGMDVATVCLNGMRMTFSVGYQMKGSHLTKTIFVTSTSMADCWSI